MARRPWCGRSAPGGSGERRDVDNANGTIWPQASVRAELPSLIPAPPNAQPMHTTEDGAVYVPPAADVLRVKRQTHQVGENRIHQK